MVGLFSLQAMAVDKCVMPLHVIVFAGMQQGGRPGGHVPPHFLADQLTLSQPWRAHYPHPVLCAPPQIFRPCDGPALHFVGKIGEKTW